MIDPSLPLDKFLPNIEQLKDAYSGVIASFSYFRKKELIEYKRQIKKEIYSIQTEEWKRNLIWRFFNDEEELELVQHLLGGTK